MPVGRRKKDGSRSADSLFASALPILEKLIAFDTTSSKSNLSVLHYLAAELEAAGAALDWVHAPGGKANLIATLGPSAAGGVLLSGHSDVVPVDGQNWSSDPWTLTPKDDGRLHGRGTSDMKTFVALSIALAQSLCGHELARPLVIAVSHDEEVGCLGAPGLIERLVAAHPPPAAVIVGEPTGMELVTAHKGITIFRITVRGHEAHSSLTHLGASAIMAAMPILAALRDLSDIFSLTNDEDSPFVPPGPTLTVGMINGGTAGNILAKECSLLCDLRSPSMAARVQLESISEIVQAVDAQLRARFDNAGAEMEILCNVPPLEPCADSAAGELVRTLTGDNAIGRAVAYGAEAGYFQSAGFSTVICGPGSIEQAHQPDEYIELSQIHRGADFMLALSRQLQSG